MTAELPSWAENLAVFDTETTGVNTATARIVSATLAIMGPRGEILERYDWLINPGIEIPDGAARVHGISTEVARKSGIDAAVGVEQIVGAVLGSIERGFPLVAYNAPYDLTLLKNEAARYGIAFPATLSPVLDPLILDKQLDRYRRGKRVLTLVAEHYGVTLDQAHDAGADAIAAGQVLQQLARKFSDQLPETLEELHESQIVWAAEQAENFQEYMRRVKDPSFLADGSWPFRDK